MMRTTRLRWISPCLLCSIVLLANAALAQQPFVGSDTVLPPPPGPAAPPPTLAPQPTLPNAGPFAPAAPPAGAPGNCWELFTDLPFLPEHYFGDVEIDILKPHLKAALVETIPLSNGSQGSVHPPTSQLNWTAAPRFEVGWFLPGNLGYFAFSYRGFAADGRQDVTALDGTPFALRSRLDVNQIAIDYGTMPYSFAPRWFVTGRLGMAAADVFFDNQANSSRQGLDASNNFSGAGPHLRADVWREFNLLPGLALFLQPDFMVLVGRTQQRYRENLTLPGSTISGSYLLRKTQTAPVFTLRTGLSYTPRNLSSWRFMVGYEFEDWWNVGQIPQDAPRGQFYTNGVFLRAMVSY